MDHLARYMDEEGEYAVFLGSLTAKSQSEWAKAAIARQNEKYPKMILVTKKIEDHDDRSLAYEKTNKLLTTYPDLRGILALGMTASSGVGAAIEETGIQKSVAVVGTGLASACRPYLKSGAINLLCFWDPADAGYVMNKLAVMVLEDKQVTDRMDLGVPGYRNIKKRGKILYGAAWVDVTKDNMTTYQF
jgi:simple sugar transport system substrate-binding protein